MLPFIFVLIGVAGVFFFASATRNHGWYWSDLLCQQGTMLCDNPRWLLFAVGAVILYGMLRTMAKG